MVLSSKYFFLLPAVLLAGMLSTVTVAGGSNNKNQDMIECDPANSSTPDQIVACIKKNKIINDMKDFQSFADKNPDPTYPNGLGGFHGSRDPGSPGSAATIDYLVKKLKNAGYKVTLQPFTFRYTAPRTLPVLSQISPSPQSYKAGSVRLGRGIAPLSLGLYDDFTVEGSSPEIRNS